jgi:hypothetical protein
MCRLLGITHSLLRSGRFFAGLPNHAHDKFDLAALCRVRDRVDGVAQLLSEATKNLRLLGVGKNAPFININGKMVGLQDASRIIRAIQTELKEKKVGDAFSGTIAALGAGAVQPASDPWNPNPVPPTYPPNQPPYPPNQPPKDPPMVDVNKPGFSLGDFVVAWLLFGPKVFESLFNDEEDDEARNLVSHTSHADLQKLSDFQLVQMINAMLDGPTGDDDEAAILKILESCDCDRRARLVGRVGLDRLLDDIDGTEWDHLVVLLVKCGIIGFDRMDDDASRRFVNSHSCSQLGLLNMDSVRQLVLNMFSGSCGDDDEDAILKLLGCQSTPRLQQLVSMPGTDVGAFDDKFDGSQWDDLEAFFAANGITLDP